ncbi:hypothetical protein [Methanoculleus taiwanensis]|nr:hypothetical protein [Methanoculleus taiwanensis]
MAADGAPNRLRPAADGEGWALPRLREPAEIVSDARWERRMAEPLPGLPDHWTFGRVEPGRCEFCDRERMVYRSREARANACQGRQAGETRRTFILQYLAPGICRRGFPASAAFRLPISGHDVAF